MKSKYKFAGMVCPGLSWNRTEFCSVILLFNLVAYSVLLAVLFTGNIEQYFHQGLNGEMM